MTFELESRRQFACGFFCISQEEAVRGPFCKWATALYLKNHGDGRDAQLGVTDCAKVLTFHVEAFARAQGAE